MTATLNPTSNGQSRKTLSTQLDRLDRILDGLDGALQGAITDAVKEAVSVAVSEAVHATLIEIVSNPEVLGLLRTGVIPVAQPLPEATPEPTKPREQVRQGMSSAWQWTLKKFKAAGSAIASRARKIKNGITGTVEQAQLVGNLKRPVCIALAVGLVVGLIAAVSSPWLAGLVSGLAATGAALGTQLALWTRKLFIGLQVHTAA